MSFEYYLGVKVNILARLISLSIFHQIPVKIGTYTVTENMKIILTFVSVAMWEVWIHDEVNRKRLISAIEWRLNWKTVFTTVVKGTERGVVEGLAFCI